MTDPTKFAAAVAEIRKAVTIPEGIKIWIQADHIMIGNEKLCMAITAQECADGRHIRHATDGMVGLLERLGEAA